jgi:pilus assembly protein CpaB
MEKLNKKIIVISVILAIAATFLIYVYIKKATVKTEDIQYANVYVATKTLTYGHTMADADIKLMEIPESYVNDKAVEDKSKIIGKILEDRIIEGEQILQDRLVDNDKSTLSHSLPEGMRAVSINVNEQIDVANMLRPGDFVDVIASFESEEMPNAEVKTVLPRITKIIIQNVKILSLGQDRILSVDKIKDPPKTVTLSVAVQDVEKLVFASEYAILRLALRPSGDNNSVNTNGTIRGDMVPAGR